MIKSYKKEDILTTFDGFVKPLLDMAVMIGFVISLEQMKDVANIEFLDSNGNVVAEPTENTTIANMRVTAKPGKEDDIDGVHCKGEGIIKLKVKKYSSVLKVRDLGELTPVSNSESDKIDAIKKALLLKME
ncbi:hypothetical protein SLITO_v1c07270 [Spiroplasma litorale]|uniref:Uncharacterized protein n=1 Tax=Spiroplasma litorale TaxID=216942 RepID=A0A0K1W2P3_9MOLU|nr:hypothetical protein [Spiroplasma litorale]AKX34352.1 hypothetical protein SLITO_v1c07270 [Spiroplasma litorale]